MKHYLSVLILMLIAACSSCTRKTESTQQQTSSKPDCPPIDTTGFIGNIDLETASQLISAFLKHNKLGDVGRKYAIGGTFPVENFYTVVGSPTEREGPVLWFCYNKQDPNRKFFLSVEKRDDVVPNYPNKPLSIDLWAPAHIFTYQGAADEPKDIEDYLQKRVPPVGTPIRVPFGNVINYADAFMEDFGAQYCKYQFSFFNNGSIEVQKQTVNDGLIKFLTQGGVSHVRYYFGYDPKHADNQIRVILFGVDSSGNNLCQYTYPLVEGCPVQTPPIILQKSIPPQY